MAIPIEVQIACVRRELAMREHVYPRQIHAEKMTTEKAAAELGAMRGVLETLLAVQAEQQAGEPIP